MFLIQSFEDYKVFTQSLKMIKKIHDERVFEPEEVCFSSARVYRKSSHLLTAPHHMLYRVIYPSVAL